MSADPTLGVVDSFPEFGATFIPSIYTHRIIMPF